MSYRVWLRIYEGETEIFREQILGNNESFSTDEWKELGIQHGDNDEYLDEIEVDERTFIKVFKKYYYKRVKQWIERDRDAFVDEFLNETSLLWTLPEWVSYGSFAFLYSNIARKRHRGNKFTISAG